jgi:hypothetical protein
MTQLVLPVRRLVTAEPVRVCAQMKVARVKRYSPDFSKAFQHIAVHPGARVIIDRVAGVRAESTHAQFCGPNTPRSRRPTHCCHSSRPHVCPSLHAYSTLDVRQALPCNAVAFGRAVCAAMRRAADSA